MIYETNKVKLHGIARSKEKLDGKNIVRMSIGKDLKTIITCFVRDDVYSSIETTKVYLLEGYLVPKDRMQDNLAIEVTKISLTDSFDSKQYIDVMFKIIDGGVNYSDSKANRSYQVRDLVVKFHNNNIKDLNIDVSLWSKLATFNDNFNGKEAFASCYIAINNKTRKLKLVPYYLILLDVS